VAVAILNTDTTPGSFLLGFEVPPKPLRQPLSSSRFRFGFGEHQGVQPHGGEERVWVPARSIVLKSDPRLAQEDCRVWLYGARGSIGSFEDDYVWRGVPRGTPFTLGWHPYRDREWNETLLPDEFYLRWPSWWSNQRPERSVVRVVQRSGVAFREAKGGGDGDEWFDWDGTAPVSVVFDATTPPEIVEVFAVACRKGGGSVGNSDHVWAYPPDMTVIDERGPLEAPK